MSQDDNYTWQGNVFHETESESDAEEVRSDRPDCAYTVTIGHVDIPAFVSNGRLYIQAPLPLVFEAFGENLSDFIRDLEIGVSNAWGRALPLNSDGITVYGAAVAESSMVRRGRKS